MHSIRNKKALVAIIVLAAILRVITAVLLGNQVIPLPGTADQVSYHTLALRVLDGYGFTFGEGWWPATPAGAPTAHWSYLYTLFLTAVYAIFSRSALAARLIQAILVAFLQPYITYLMSRRMFGERVGLIAAGLNAFYLYFIYYSAVLMTETFYITAIMAILYLAIRIVDEIKALNGNKPGRRYYQLTILLGITMGVAVLLRQLILLVIPFILIWLWWAGGVKRTRPTVTTGVIALALIGIQILPFTIFNYTRFHRFVLQNTNAGYAFFLGNHPIHGTNFISASEMESYKDLFPRELLRLDEAALEKELLSRGLQFVIDDPGRYILLSISRIPDYFIFWPSATSSPMSNITRVGSFGLALPFMVLGLCLAIKDQRRKSILIFFSTPAFLLIVFSFVYMAIHVLTWTLVRYRLPIDALLLVFAAYGVARVFDRLRFMAAEFRKPHIFHGES